MVNKWNTLAAIAVAATLFTVPTFAAEQILPSVTPSCQVNPEGCRTFEVVESNGTLRSILKYISLQRIIQKNDLPPTTTADARFPEGSFTFRI